jgi:guanine deaminase
MELHRGHLFHISGSPASAHAAEALVHHADGGLLVDDDGVIAWSGAWPDRPSVGAVVVDHHGAFLLPGFVDTHLHYPQVHCLDAFGGGVLLHWLEQVVFPAEARLADPGRARRAAMELCDRLAAAGTTTAMVFGSQFPQAQDALFEGASDRGLRLVLGRTMMTKGPVSAEPLLTSEDDAIGLAREEVDRWHPRPEDAARSLTRVALVPRFALSLSPRAVARVGDLYQELQDRGVHLTTHLSENDHPNGGEVAAVRAAFGVDRYLDVYDGRFEGGGGSMLGRRSVFAHAVHCSADEFARLAETQSSVAHCPVSQQFLGSGTMRWRRAMTSGVTVAMGSDIAAGDEWFMPRVLNASYKAHMGEPEGEDVALHPADLLFAGTLAGARALDLEDRIGNLDAGKDADFVVLDPGRCPELGDLLEDRVPRENPVEERDALLFALLMGAREPALAAAYVRGRRLDTGRAADARAGRS